jgi:hypothetical protein
LTSEIQMPRTILQKKQRERDTYMAWVRRFPLKTIKNNDEHERASRIIGSESAVSMFLKGARGLSKSQIKKLAARFKLDACAFM